MQIAPSENVAFAHGTTSNAEPSAVSWGAILAGAAVAMVTSLVLLVLGGGLGLVTISPWSADADTARALGIGAIVWLIFMQLASSALGGFIGGRLRARWSAAVDEVFFRDTAHGLLVWAVATLLTATLFTTAATATIGGAARTGAAATLLGAAPGQTQVEGRVKDVTNEVRQEARQQEQTLRAAADEARKAAAHASLWMAVSLLAGAFVASYAGTIGGRMRDRP